jgi:hypothetical protein
MTMTVDQKGHVAKAECDKLIESLELLGSQVSLIVATMHQIRLFFIYNNVWPQNFLDAENFNNDDLDRMVAEMSAYMKSIPLEHDFDKINFIAGDAWHYTIGGIYIPNDFRQRAIKIWDILSLGFPDAYDWWEKSFDKHRYLSPRTADLIEKMAKDIQKIPTALLKS